MNLEQHAEAIITLYRGGQSCAKIGTVYGCHGSTIHALLKRHSIETHKAWSRSATSAGLTAFTDEQNQALVKAYNDGATLQDLADANGVVITTVRKRLLDLGVTMRPAGSLKVEVVGDTIRCSVCDTMKHFDLFDKHPRSSTGRMSACKTCEIKRYRLRLYNLSQESFEALVQKQEGKCGICGCTAEHPRNHGLQSLAVDHCHKGGHVRGLLCHSCNTAIGKMADNAGWLKNAITWLEPSNEKTPAV